MTTKKRKQRILNFFLLALLITAAVCGWLIYSGAWKDAAANAAVDDMQARKPPAQDGLMDFSGLRGENPDVIAWLTIPGTAIDYPVVQTGDNDYYLHRDVEKKPNINGALFLDCRVRADFSEFNHVIYGHHMNSGRMFQNLIKFREKAFFDSHASGTLYTPNQTYRLEIFAASVIPQNSVWYEFAFASPGEKEAHIQRIMGGATHCRDICLTAEDRIVLLSTCLRADTDARAVVAARLVAI